MFNASIRRKWKIEGMQACWLIFSENKSSRHKPRNNKKEEVFIELLFYYILFSKITVNKKVINNTLQFLWLKLWLIYLRMFVGFDVTEGEGVVSVLLIPLNTSFFYESGFLLISRGGFSI